MGVKTGDKVMHGGNMYRVVKNDRGVFLTWKNEEGETDAIGPFDKKTQREWAIK